MPSDQAGTAQHRIAPFDEAVSHAYIAMELCERSLRSSPTTPEDAAKTVTQIARGVSAAPARGVVHRDINPANILVSSGGRAKIADFGLACAALLDRSYGNQSPDETMILTNERMPLSGP